MSQPLNAPATPRCVLVTGGASGIGRSVVDEFLRLGDRVVVLDRDEAASDLADIATVVIGDVCRPEDNERAVEAALEKHGRLDVFVGNAGIHDGGMGLLDLTSHELADIVRRVFEVDVMGYLLGARAAAKHLVASRGCMVFTLSDASFVVNGVGAGVGYSIAKHAALGLVRHLAATLAPDVRVNAVAPGGVVTGLRKAAAGEGLQPLFDDPGAVESQVRSLNPLGLMLTAAQVAPLYSFLASPAAAGITAEVLRPDGGLSVR
jgi:2,3-dihydroxy-2,3-dihydrophenylpropionate dehydrogenase